MNRQIKFIQIDAVYLCFKSWNTQLSRVFFPPPCSVLQLVHISCLPEQKESVLLHLLKRIINVKQQVVIFFATKHHVEFFQMVSKSFPVFENFMIIISLC